MVEQVISHAGAEHSELFFTKAISGACNTDFGDGALGIHRCRCNSILNDREN